MFSNRASGCCPILSTGHETLVVGGNLQRPREDTYTVWGIKKRSDVQYLFGALRFFAQGSPTVDEISPHAI